MGSTDCSDLGSPQKGVHRVPGPGSLEGGGGHGRCRIREAVEVSRDGSQDVLWASVRCDDKEEQRVAPVLLSEGLTPVVRSSRSKESRGQEGAGLVVRHASGWREGGVQGGFCYNLLGEGVAHNRAQGNGSYCNRVLLLVLGDSITLNVVGL